MCRSLLVMFLVAAGLMLISGCGTELETGYKPKVLGVSDAERRAYYVSPFTPEAQAAQQDQKQQLESRRPGTGF